MTRAGDYPDEMATLHLIDEAATEALIAGRPVPAELEPVANLVQALRTVTNRPVSPSTELAARMTAGEFPEPSVEYWPPVHRPQGRGLGAAVRAWARTSVRVLAAAPRVVLIGGALLAATIGVGSAGFAGVLPEPVQDRFENVVESVTPYEFSGRGEESSEFGSRVSEDAEDGGVDGGDISEQARQRGEERRSENAPETPPGPPDGAGKPSDLPTPPSTGPDDPPGNPPSNPGQSGERRPTSRPAPPEEDPPNG